MSTNPPLPLLDVGPRDAASVVFIHGIAQSKQAFARVLGGPLARSLRLVAFDLRGHGDAPVPTDDDPPTRARLAADVAAVIDHCRLVRPWLAGWSFGGAVIGEYLRQRGDAALGGLVYLAGSVRTGRAATALFGPAMMMHARDLLSDDPVAYAATARAFTEASVHVAQPPAVIDAMVADMRRVPARIRRALLAGNADYTAALAATRVPIATIHGELDAVVLPAMSELVATCRPDAMAIRIAGAGHVPWLEAPARFDAALARAVSTPAGRAR